MDTHDTRSRGSQPATWLCAAAIAIALAPQAARAADAVAAFTESPGGKPPAPWRVSGLPNQKKPFTQFAVERWDGEAALRLEADKSYGNLIHPLAATQALHHLSWRWQLDEPNPLADLREKSTEDVAVRVCVLFDLPDDKIPLGDRAMLKIARSAHGGRVPGATVCYVWDQKLPPGTALHSPFTSRIRMLVLRGQESPAHAWVGERRDIDADFKQLFGDESDVVPPVIGVGVGADADNTKGRSLAHVGTLQLQP